jgi:hypothetical protein
MAAPVEAVKVLGISTRSSDKQLEETFMAAYVRINGGSPHNYYTKAFVNEAIENWKCDHSIPHWLARACVLVFTQKQSKPMYNRL